MINPNEGKTKKEVERLRKESNASMRQNLFDSLEALMRDYKMTWEDLGGLLGIQRVKTDPRRTRTTILKSRILFGQITINDLNLLASFFDAEPYILFRERNPK